MTTDADTTRRLAILKRRPSLSNKTDDFLTLCLEESRAFFLEYTNRDTDPGESVDLLLVELATYKANAEGVENVKKAKDGEIERENFDALPPMLKNRLNNWRLIRGLHYATPVN